MAHKRLVFLVLVGLWILPLSANLDKMQFKPASVSK